jgi:signal transduction histidine kinase
MAERGIGSRILGRSKTMGDYRLLLALSDEIPRALQTIHSAFETQNYQVTAATSSGSATEALYAKHFDLVITDLLDILKKTKEVTPDAVVIILTGDCKVTSVIKALRLGADDFFIEPLEQLELMDLVTYCGKRLEAKRKNNQRISSGDGSNGESLNMLKIMSHDVRGSLLSMSAILKLLTRGYYGKIDEGVAKHLKELFSRTTSLIGVTEEYLDSLLDIDDDLGEEGKAWDLMKDIIEPLLEELSVESKDNRIRLRPYSDVLLTKGIPIKANRPGLKAVFRNLIRNAIKYGEKGCTITIGIEDHGRSYQLNVHNEGKPIPEEYRDKLFSKCMHTENRGNGSESNYGMGLGLFLTKNIIEKHGGAIWYGAEENGSTFTFTLPSGMTSSILPLFPIQPAPPCIAIANM